MNYLLRILALSIVLICSSCSNSEEGNIDLEIQRLKTDEQKNAFLEQVLIDDQKYRKQSDSIMSTFGYESAEHLENIQSMMNQDEVNLEKIRTYRNLFPYPNPINYSRNAIAAPRMVIHHQPNNGSRLEFFPALYKAYLQGSLPGEDLTFFLGRMHSNAHGQRIKFQGRFTTEMELDTLTKTLGLVEIMEEVQKSLQ